MNPTTVKQLWDYWFSTSGRCVCGRHMSGFDLMWEHLEHLSELDEREHEVAITLSSDSTDTTKGWVQ